MKFRNDSSALRGKRMMVGQEGGRFGVRLFVCPSSILFLEIFVLPILVPSLPAGNAQTVRLPQCLSILFPKSMIS